MAFSEKNGMQNYTYNMTFFKKKNPASLRYNLHTIKLNDFKRTIQRFLENLFSCASITTIQF